MTVELEDGTVMTERDVLKAIAGRSQLTLDDPMLRLPEDICDMLRAILPSVIGEEKTASASEILRHRYVVGDSRREAMLEIERLIAQLALLYVDCRTLNYLITADDILDSLRGDLASVDEMFEEKLDERQ